MGYIKTRTWRGAGIALCAIAVAVCALLAAQVPAQAFAVELAAANGDFTAGSEAKAAPKAKAKSLGISTQYFDDGEADIPEDAVELQLDEGVDVMAAAGEVKWFKFTPSDDDVYNFYTTGMQYGEDGEDYDSYVDTHGSLYVVEDGMLTRIAYDDDSNGNGCFSIKRELTGGETYYLACSEYDDGEANYTVFVETFVFDEYDLNGYDWNFEHGRILSKGATSLQAVLNILRPYATHPLDGAELPYDELSTAACYHEVYDAQADEYYDVEASFGSPLEPGDYYLSLTGKDPYVGMINLWFEVYDEADLTYYTRSYEDQIPLQNATSEAALVKALNIRFYDFEDNLVAFTYGKDYSIKWYTGFDGAIENDVSLTGFPHEIGAYSARLIGKDPERYVTIEFEIYDANDFANLGLYFGRSTYYYDGTAVSVAKLGGIDCERYDSANNSWVEVPLREGVDYDVEWGVYEDDDETANVLPSAPKDQGEYFARITAKGGTYSGTVVLGFRIVDPYDLGNYYFRGVEILKRTGTPITLEQLALKAYRFGGDPADVQFEASGWYKVTHDGGEDGYSEELIDQSEVVEPGMYNVELTGVPPFTGYGRFGFEILVPNSLQLAEVSGVAEKYEYTGAPIAVKPAVKMDGKTLVEGRDYSITLYYNGKDDDRYENATSVKELGWYTLNINAIEGGDYVDCYTVLFEVKKAVKPQPQPQPNPAPKAAAVGATLAAGKATYKVTKSGAAPEVAFTKSTAAGSVTVPATVSSGGVTYKVTSIAAKAFKGNKKITKVVVGDNIVSIGKSAFEKCPKLKAATLGASVKTVGKSVFKGDKKLKTITVKSGALTKASAKNIVKGSKIKSVKLSGKAAKAKKKAYKKYFGKKVKVK